jgi:hypothetical protein
MRAITDAYHLGVLWLLSIVARRVVERIYHHGHEDGATELREWMRKELQQVQADLLADRARSYRQGFADAMRMYDDEPIAEPVERVN